MKIVGKLVVGDETFENEVDITDMDEDSIDKAVYAFTAGLRSTVMQHLQVGDYNPNRKD